ncbi:hypothetical protein KUV50_04985 [Membranicola marinus]|uniref:Uncharacterized protein n=1 Tax=Membranihabitans marinus TaxID=1227546 RepID=A0A953L8A4_9BACT|nr:hypothetical protein [Membranihabitans marinus]MBY5957480.1 hypothetical protein [Membranihabitans marinus]
MIRRYLLLVLHFGVLSHLVGQEVYYVTFLNPQTISRTDLSNCASLDPITLPDDIDVGSIAFDINFHPDSRMYIITHNYLLQYDFTSRSSKIIEDGSVFYSDAGTVPGMAIDEEGHFAINGGEGIVGMQHVVKYDLRSRQVLQDQSSYEWSYHFIGRIHDYFIPVFRSKYFYPDSSGFWVFDLDGNKPVKYFDWGQDREYTLQLLLTAQVRTTILGEGQSISSLMPGYTTDQPVAKILPKVDVKKVLEEDRI